MKITRAELIDAWLKALESGEYKQADGVLRNDSKDRFCCLGVACDVANKMGLRKKDYFKDKHNEVLPKGLARFLGIAKKGEFVDFIIHNGKSYCNLTELNDEGVRFKTIARIIREQLAKGNFEKS